MALDRHRTPARPHGASPATRSADQSAGCGPGAGTHGRTRGVAPRTEEHAPMKANLDSDAFVFFGATGDLAYKKIFPALYAMVHRGGLNIPIIGMARAGWSLDKLRERARDSVQAAGDFEPECFAKLSALLNYVDGDYVDPATYVL